MLSRFSAFIRDCNKKIKLVLEIIVSILAKVKFWNIFSFSYIEQGILNDLALLNISSFNPTKGKSTKVILEVIKEAISK